MPSEEEYKRVKKEADDLKKQKIIMQAKLKQKEDKITDLTKRIREMSITAKSAAPTAGQDDKVKDLEEELARSRKVNKDLRAENEKLTKELEETKKKLKTLRPKMTEDTKLEKVSLPGAKKVEPVSASASATVSAASEIQFDNEQVEYLEAQVAKKDGIITKLMDQLNMFSPEQIAQIGSSYMKTRQMNAKVRELKSQLDMAKKNEAAMRQRLDEMQRKMALKDEDLSW